MRSQVETRNPNDTNSEELGRRPSPLLHQSGVRTPRTGIPPGYALPYRGVVSCSLSSFLRGCTGDWIASVLGTQKKKRRAMMFSAWRRTYAELEEGSRWWSSTLEGSLHEERAVCASGNHTSFSFSKKTRGCPKEAHPSTPLSYLFHV